MALITINGIKLYAYHGCFEEEQEIGQYYVIDIAIDLNAKIACEHDDLTNTIDYAAVYDIVIVEMAVRSKLIEHVAYRIKKALLKHFSSIKGLEVSVTKPFPPVQGEIQSVKVTV